MKTQMPPHRLTAKSVVKFEQEGWQRPETLLRKARVITLSRQLGSGGRRVAETLGRWLRWTVWDREILDVLARQSHFRSYQARAFELLDERRQSGIQALASSLVGDVDKHLYMCLLPRALHTIARNDAIIVGRGAHLLLPRSARIRIVASLDTRVRNLVQYEGLSEGEARKRIKITDQERKAFLEEFAARLGCWSSGVDRESSFDLVINTDGVDVQEAASMALAVARRKLGVVEMGGAPAPSGEPIAERGPALVPTA